MRSAILLLPLAAAETLMEREYGAQGIDAGLDDGALLRSLSCRSALLRLFAPAPPLTRPRRAQGTATTAGTRRATRPLRASRRATCSPTLPPRPTPSAMALILPCFLSSTSARLPSHLLPRSAAAALLLCGWRLTHSVLHCWQVPGRHAGDLLPREGHGLWRQ